jgi:hypothetical protein
MNVTPTGMFHIKETGEDERKMNIKRGCEM